MCILIKIRGVTKHVGTIKQLVCEVSEAHTSYADVITGSSEDETQSNINRFMMNSL